MSNGADGTPNGYKMPTSFRINIHDLVELVHRIVLSGAPTSSCQSCENDKKPMHVNKNKVLKKALKALNSLLPLPSHTPSRFLASWQHHGDASTLPKEC